MNIPEPFQVKKITHDTDDVFTLTLESCAKKQGVRFSPGQFNMLYQMGFGEVAISISGDPVNNNELVHTIRAIGSVTKRLQKLKVGDQIGVRGPFGNPWPLSKITQDVLIIVGGLGFAPLRPVLYHLSQNTELYHKVTLIYGTRTPKDILYKNELEQWEKNGFNVQVTVDHADTHWRGHTGVLTPLITKHISDPGNTLALICGPEIMMHFAIQELKRAEVPDNNIYLSMERNMKCAVGFCGHCQYGPYFICKDGPVFPYTKLKSWLTIKEL
jgi:NAD(P)H-flavin reductase